MKNIITAIGNERLNEELKKENNIKIINKDIQYREGVLEILESENQIDFIIISDDIPGEISFFDLISKITDSVDIPVLAKETGCNVYNHKKQCVWRYESEMK